MYPGDPVNGPLPSVKYRIRENLQTILSPQGAKVKSFIDISSSISSIDYWRGTAALWLAVHSLLINVNINSVDLVVKSGVGFSRAKPSNCFRCLEKLFFPFHFDTSLSSFMLWGLAELSNNGFE